MDDFDFTRQALLQQRNQYANQRNLNIPEGRMIGRHYVPPHALQILAEGLRSVGGLMGQERAERNLNEVISQRQKAIADSLRQFGDMSRGVPEGVDSTSGAAIPARAPDLQGAYNKLIESGVPELRQMGISGLAQDRQLQAQSQMSKDERTFKSGESQLDRAFRSGESQLDRTFRSGESQLDRTFRSGESRLDRQSAMANRPERMLTVMGPNGEALSLPQAQAQGMPLYNAAAANQLQKQKKSIAARQQLSDMVQQLSGNYDALEKGGGITSEKRGAIDNIAARLESTSLGQAVGGALGTKNQRQRQEIKLTRPLLTSLIKDATNMSAQQMNSNVELQLWLDTATDPNAQVEANRTALANLDRLFGAGALNKSADSGRGAVFSTPAAKTQQQKQMQSPNLDALLEKYK